jgi:hypothetical protein
MILCILSQATALFGDMKFIFANYPQHLISFVALAFITLHKDHTLA